MPHALPLEFTDCRGGDFHPVGMVGHWPDPYNDYEFGQAEISPYR